MAGEKLSKVRAQDLYEHGHMKTFDAQGLDIGDVAEVTGNNAGMQYPARIQRVGERLFVDADGPLATEQ